MFKFLKDKFKSFFKKSSEEIIKESAEKELPKTEEKEKAGVKKAEEKVEVKQQAVEKGGFIKRLTKKFTTTKLDEQLFTKIWEPLEIILFENNVALPVVESIRSNLEAELIAHELKKEELERIIRDALKKSVRDLLVEPFSLVNAVKEGIKKDGRPYIILFFGINGSGKTTTIAKIAHLLQKNNLKPVLAAADTFRAASIEQLQKHGAKLGVIVIKQDYGADPAAVAYDAIQYSKAHMADVVLIDTAGRMHTQANLMREMEKITRVAKPDLRIFVGESIAGNDVVEQAKNFSNSVGIDAVVLTKAEVDEKGGAALSVGYVTKKPVLLLGVGQDYNDIKVFDKEKIIQQLGLE